MQANVSFHRTEDTKHDYQILRRCFKEAVSILWHDNRKFIIQIQLYMFKSCKRFHVISRHYANLIQIMWTDVETNTKKNISTVTTEMKREKKQVWTVQR